MAQQHDSTCPKCKLMFDSLENYEDDDFAKKLKEILFGHINDTWREFIRRYPNYKAMPPNVFSVLFSKVNDEIMEKTFSKDIFYSLK